MIKDWMAVKEVAGGVVLSVLMMNNPLAIAESNERGQVVGKPDFCAKDYGPSCAPTAEYSCTDLLASHKEYLYGQLVNSSYSPDGDTLEQMTEVFDSGEPCEEKVISFEKLLNSHWGTEPWCKVDKKTFMSRYTGEVAASLPTSAADTVDALLKATSPSCSETLAAAVTVVKLYNPEFTLYDVPSQTDGATSSSGRPNVSSVNRSVLEGARLNSAQRKLSRASKQLKSCQSNVKRLRRGKK